jgi:non-ribosomal peptide synthetase component F
MSTVCLTHSLPQLDALSNTIALSLLRHGVQREQPVCVCMPRSALWVATLIGVLRASAAYVPLDPDYAQSRLQVRPSLRAP